MSFTIIWMIVVVFCVIMFFVTLPRYINAKKVQNTADYNFESRNCGYLFVYSIKKFRDQTKQMIKFIIKTPTINVSDVNKICKCYLTKISFIDKKSGKSYEMPNKEFLSDIIQPSYDYLLVVPDECIDANGTVNLSITFTTCWILGGKEINDCIKFDFMQ